MNISGEAKALLSLGFITLVILGGAIFFLSKDSVPSSKSPQLATQKIDPKKLIREDSQKIIVPNAKVTIVEFIDYECEACKAVHPVSKQILKEYEGKVNFVVRNFPNHNNSLLAVNAVEAAGEQGKYWEYHDKLFEDQLDWGEKKEPQTELFIKYAQELDLDIEKFKAVLESGKYNEKANRDKQEGIEIGVNGTPTFYINGMFAGNVMSYEEFKGKIDAEL